jgi:guanylate kinase
VVRLGPGGGVVKETAPGERVGLRRRIIPAAARLARVSPGELNGRDYVFISPAEFEAGIRAGRWAEWARVHGHCYGTSAEVLEQALAAGRDVLMDIDVQGAGQICRRFPESVTIFILPPSLEVLEQRLRSRGTDRPEAIDLRLQNARREMAQTDAYRHVIVNDDLATAVAELIAILESYRSGREN